MSRTYTPRPTYTRGQTTRTGTRGARSTNADTEIAVGRSDHQPTFNRGRASRHTGRGMASPGRGVHGSYGTAGRGYSSPGQTPRGRGYGTNPAQSRPGAFPEDDLAISGGYPGRQDPGDPDQAQPTQQDRTQRRDAYTMVQPDQKKRNAIQQQADKETADYNKYKESQKQSYVSYSGTVGGSGVSESASRVQAQRTNSRIQTTSREKSEQYRSKQRQQEDAENQKKKQQGRQQAVNNEKREEKRTSTVKQDHGRTNELFLQKLEREAATKRQDKVLSSSTAKALSAQATSTDRDDQNPYRSSPARQNTVGATGGATSHYSTGHVTSYEDLLNRFPQYDPDLFNDVLTDCQGNMDMAADMLAAMEI